MWTQEGDSAAGDSDEESSLSSEDWGDIQCEILEKQRDEANMRLTELEEASNQLLKEIGVLEMQFQIERSCRESAEALAFKVSKENNILKRKSRMLMPRMPDIPEDLISENLDVEADLTVDGDVVDSGGCSTDDTLLLETQAKITELQVSVDGLLAEKLLLEQQVEELTTEQIKLREQLAVEVEEKEAILRKMSKQSKTMNKIKRVSKLVTEEFTEMSQKLELEQDLRQHAEVVAHQMLSEQTAAQRWKVMEPGGSESDVQLQLQQALEQISSISTILSDVQLYYQEQVKQIKGSVEESADLSELQNLREQQEKTEEERKSLEKQLFQANTSITQLREEVKQFKETYNRKDETKDVVEESTPPPPPPPPPPTPVINLQDFLRSRRKGGVTAADQKKPAPSSDIKAKAVDEMMERIKKGIILRPIKNIQDQRSENRKSVILELKGVLDNIKRQHHRRLPSRRGNIRDAELLMVLQRRRRVIGDTQDTWSSNLPPDPQPGQQCVPAAGDGPWAGESGTAPVLRRLKQNREQRDSRIRASALIISHGDLKHTQEQIPNIST
uniref:Uncharacterized protein n=2 Tax=Nothobranchius kadleci TaxID=1051664 RepID=A0A1A8D144_NOTKA